MLMLAQLIDPAPYLALNSFALTTRPTGYSLFICEMEGLASD
jgi:hypothetical protein